MFLTPASLWLSTDVETVSLWHHRIYGCGKYSYRIYYVNAMFATSKSLESADIRHLLEWRYKTSFS